LLVLAERQRLNQMPETKEIIQHLDSSTLKVAVAAGLTMTRHQKSEVVAVVAAVGQRPEVSMQQARRPQRNKVLLAATGQAEVLADPQQAAAELQQLEEVEAARPQALAVLERTVLT